MGLEFQLPAYPDGYALTTSRLELRAPVPGDEAELWPLVRDPRLTEFLSWDPHRTIEETRGFVAAIVAAQQAGAGFHWIVRREGPVIGLVSLIDVRRTKLTWTWDRAELAYWIGPDLQGKGFAGEASLAILRFAFQTLAFHKIVVYHALANPRSGRVASKLGFRLVGDEREAFRKHGIWHDLRHLEMLKSEFEAQYPDS